MTEPTGKYRYAENYTCGGAVLHDSLVAEGAYGGRHWALIRQWNENPRYSDEFGESYVMRVDLSEWWNVYSRNAAAFHAQRFGKPSWPVPFASVGGLANRSPGWWDNGFCTQMCYQAKLVKYRSETEKFEQIVRYGFDFDNASDIETAAAAFVMSLGPMVSWFGERGKPRAAPDDDF